MRLQNRLIRIELYDVDNKATMVDHVRVDGQFEFEWRAVIQATLNACFVRYSISEMTIKQELDPMGPSPHEPYVTVIRLTGRKRS